MYSIRRRHTKKQRHTKKHRHTTKCRHTKKHRHTTKCSHRRSKRLRTMSMRRMRMRGGNSTLMPAAIDPLQGSAYDAGSAAPMPSGNHYAPSSYGISVGGVDPAMRAGAVYNGGNHNKNKNNKNKRMRGGGMFSDFLTAVVPDELINIGRSIPASFEHLSDKFQGVNSSPSSQVYPTQQPLVQAVKPSSAIGMPDIIGSYNSANSAVAAI